MTPERLDLILDRMRAVRVLVVGDLMLDVYLRGQASRISPEAPVPVVRVTEEWAALGGAANVASNVVALGGSCELVGCVGLDRSGDRLRAELARVGIGARGIHSALDRPTTVKTRVMAQHQQVVRYDLEVELDIDPDLTIEIIRVIEALADHVDAFVLEDYDKGVLVPAVIRSALDAAKRRGLPVIVDPKARNFHAYRGATIFKPNLGELAAALRSPVRYDDIAWLEQTRRDLGCDHLLVTLGEEGMALLSETGEYVRVPTTARSVYDVSGAGDTVTAVLALSLGAGATVSESAIVANLAAGVEVGKAGVAAVTPDELRQSMIQYQVV